MGRVFIVSLDGANSEQKRRRHLSSNSANFFYGRKKELCVIGANIACRQLIQYYASGNEKVDGTL